jgi:hypothetical protein
VHSPLIYSSFATAHLSSLHRTPVAWSEAGHLLICLVEPEKCRDRDKSKSSISLEPDKTINSTVYYYLSLRKPKPAEDERQQRGRWRRGKAETCTAEAAASPSPWVQWWYGVGVQHCCVVHLCSCADWLGAICIILVLLMLCPFQPTPYSQKPPLADTETLAGVTRAPGSFPPNSHPLV